MTRPKFSDKYPPNMLDAMQRAFSLGELVIPTEKPQALRLYFYGLGGALRKEGKPELFNALSFSLQAAPPALVISLKENTAFSKSIASALESPVQPSAASEAEDMLSRLLGGPKP